METQKELETLIGAILSRKQYGQREMVCVAGIPGAGKTKFICNSSEFEDFVNIDPDAFRQYAPDYRLCNSNTLVETTNQYMERFSNALLDAALKGKLSVVVASTFTDTAFWRQTFSRIGPLLEDYRTKRLIVLSQPLEECRKGCEKRAKEASSAEPKPRPVDDSFIQNRFDRFNRAIGDIITMGVFREVFYYARKKLEDVYLCVGKTTR